MPVPFAKEGIKNEPVVILLEILSDKFLNLFLNIDHFETKRFGLILFDDRSRDRYKARCAAFMDQEWPLLDADQEEKVQKAYLEINEAFLTGFEAWLEDIKSKMGVSVSDNRRKKPKGAPGGIEDFLRLLQKDLRKKKS